jgi:hypothetical protein
VSDAPVNLTYGTPLADSQISGMATWTVGGTVVAVPGSWSFASASGTVLNAGAGQSESVTFIPTEGNDYVPVTIAAFINVAQAAPVVSANPVTLTYGMPLADHQLSGTATWTVGGTVVAVPGFWSFTSALGTVLHAGAGNSESVIFTPTHGTDYLSVTITVIINVLKATPTITWADPANISYGTPLGTAQLDATPSVPGTFLYNPGFGTVLSAGQGQTLVATFAPADTADYNAVTTTAQINVVYLPVVTVQSLQLTRVPVTTGQGKRPRTQEEWAVLLKFSGALTGTGTLAAYQLYTGKTIRGHSIFNKNVPIRVFSSTSTSVTLLPKVALNPSAPVQVRVIESDLVDSSRRPLNGGQRFTKTFGNNRIVTGA